MKLKTVHSNNNKKRLVYFMMVHQKCTAQKTVIGSNTSEALLNGCITNKHIHTVSSASQPITAAVNPSIKSKQLMTLKRGNVKTHQKRTTQRLDPK